MFDYLFLQIQVERNLKINIMCSIDTLQSMAQIYSDIANLYLNKYEYMEKISVMRLKRVDFSNSEGKEIPDIEIHPNDDIYNKITEVFEHILSPTLKNKNKSVWESISIYLNSLNDIVQGFPGFKKRPINKEFEEVIDEAIDIAKKNEDNNLRINIIKCKYNIYNV